MGFIFYFYRRGSLPELGKTSTLASFHSQAHNASNSMNHMQSATIKPKASRQSLTAQRATLSAKEQAEA